MPDYICNRHICKTKISNIRKPRSRGRLVVKRLRRTLLVAVIRSDTHNAAVLSKYMFVYGIIEGQKHDLGRHDHIVLKRIISFKDIISLFMDVKTLG